ncbi:hypothetical protein [Pseudonocardia sp.]|jgi:hypothetical protein|uniref:hypothetical protein n=1 Tax=Pseudonocardia sp. TaxID=60912 RepID=UPI0031FD1D8E
MEKAEADAEVSRLVRLERAHGQAQNMLKHRITQDTNQLAALRSEIPHLEAAIAQRVDTRGDQFRTQVGDRWYAERAEAARAVSSRITDVLNASMFDRADHPLGELGGFPLTAKRQYRDNEPYALVDVVGLPLGTAKQDPRPRTLQLEKVVHACSRQSSTPEAEQGFAGMIINNYFHASSNVAIGSTDVKQSVKPPAKGDVEGLVYFLREMALSPELLADLRVAAKADEDDQGEGRGR